MSGPTCAMSARLRGQVLASSKTLVRCLVMMATLISDCELLVAWECILYLILLFSVGLRIEIDVWEGLGQ